MPAPVLSNALDLLRRLEPAVRPGPAAGSNGGSTALFESRSFDDLLSDVFTGAVRSGRDVQVAGDVQPEIDHAQLERLGAAADRVEASGAKRTLMMLDGRGLVMDVASRTVVAEMKPGDVGGILQVDAAMVVSAGANIDRANGSPFAGINALTAVRMNMAAESAIGEGSYVTQAHELIAPKTRSVR